METQMRKEKENKAKKQRTQGLQKEKRRRALTGTVVAAFAAALAVFTVMVSAERTALATFEKKDIYVAKVQIPRGQKIRPEKAEELLELRSVDAQCVPETALSDPAQLEGLTALYGIEPGTLLTTGMFLEPEEALQGLVEPVLVGFKAEDLYQVVGGILRPGDRIHIYRVDADLGETTLRWSNLYVADVFDTTGNMLEGEGSGSSRFNIYLSRKDVEEFYQGMDARSLRVVKVCE